MTITNKERRQCAYNKLDELMNELFALEAEGTLFSDEVSEMCRYIVYAQKVLMEEPNDG